MQVEYLIYFFFYFLIFLFLEGESLIGLGM